MMTYTGIFLAFVAYLVGSVSFAIIVSRLLRLEDPRNYGSGNPGATNVLRSGSKKAAALTLLGDALKGLVPIALFSFFASGLGLTNWDLALCSVTVLLGHMWPVFFRFQGGKGVATAVGVLFALYWPLALCCFAIWLVMAFGFKISSLAALIAALASPLLAFGFGLAVPYQYAIAVIAGLVFYRHIPNIKKLLAGKEGKIGNKAKH